MKRIDTLLLLEEIKGSCKSSPGLDGAVVTEHKNEKDWVLSITWIPNDIDKECLDKIALKHNLEVTSTEGHVVFRLAESKK
jgi:hypothetical protein